MSTQCTEGPVTATSGNEELLRHTTRFAVIEHWLLRKSSSFHYLRIPTHVGYHPAVCPTRNKNPSIGTRKLTSQPTTLAAKKTRPPAPTPYAGFGEALKDWLLRVDRSQKELAHVLHVDPSTVTTWVHGQKRPDGLSLVKMLVTFKGWLRGDWNPLEALDAIACLGYDWSRLLEVSVRHFQRGAILNTCGPGGRPLGQRSAGSSSRPGLRFT